MKPKISIIVPVYNAENFLYSNFNSFINQDIGFEFLEIIFIDDCSTDNSRSIIKGFEEKYDNVKCFYLEKNNGFPGKSRNMGIVNANADYIMFCDNDDYYSIDFCRVMFDVILKNPNIDFVSSRYNLLTNNKIVGLNNSFLENYPSVMKINNITNFPEIIYTISNLTIWNKIYKKEFLINNNIKFYDNKFNEDFLFSLNCFIKSINGFILLNDYAGYNYRTDEIKFKKNARLKKSVNDNISSFKDLKILIDNNCKSNFLCFEKIIAEPLIITMQMFLGNDLTYEEQIEILNKLKPYLKEYKINTRLVNNFSILINIILNIFVKLSSFSNKFTIFFSKIYKFVF